MTPASRLYMIPSWLDEEGQAAIPAYITDVLKQCQVLFVENERSARRFIKALDRTISIDQYEWMAIHKAEEQAREAFIRAAKSGKIIGVLSEAGCPGIADPGQVLAALAQEMEMEVIPLVGPNSMVLALMASGMNGQQFRFLGYLPIDAQQRIKSIRELEADSARTGGTQIFIETPYRNQALLDALLRTCQPNTRLCIAVNLTGKEEKVITRKIAEWKSLQPGLHKKPAIFLVQA